MNMIRPAGRAGLLALVLAVALSACSSRDARFEALIAGDNSFDVLIAGGMVVDGTGSDPVRADVLIRGDEIVYVGRVDSERVVATSVVDAAGRVVAPGFIDPHAHGNPIGSPAMANFLSMGATTIVLGQDGGSPGVTNLDEWFNAVDSVGPSVNVATFVGHGTLRRLAGVGNNPEPDPAQIDSMTALLRRQLDDGAFGLSTGLEYTPGAYAGRAELRQLADAAGQAGKPVMSHLRTEDDDALEGAIRELLDLAGPAAVHVSHIKSVYGKGSDRAEEILAVLDSARASGVQVTADTYPYTASYTGIGIVFPLWARPPNDYRDVVQTRRDELADYLRRRVTLRNGPEATLIGTGRFSGLTLAEVSNELEKPFEDVLIDDLGPDGASAAYFVMNEALQNRLAQDPHVMFSSDGSLTGYHPRGHGTFARVIEHHVREMGLLSLPEAVRKMTSLPASTIGLEDRGTIAAGFRADVVVFDPDAVRETASYADPHRLAAGFVDVLVNGQFAIRNGNLSQQRFGRALRRR